MEAAERLPSSIRARLADLKRLFRQAEQVASAYIFGSVAEAVSNQQSDVDFAVRLKPGLSAPDRHQIRMRLIQEIEQVLEGDVDVVVLDDASLKMIHPTMLTAKRRSQMIISFVRMALWPSWALCENKK